MHWFFSCFDSFCCSSAFFLAGLSWRIVVDLRPSEHSGIQSNSWGISIKNRPKLFRCMYWTHHRAPISPWMMRLPCHKPLSKRCHPIYPNHRSGKKNNGFRAPSAFLNKPLTFIIIDYNALFIYMTFVKNNTDKTENDCGHEMIFFSSDVCTRILTWHVYLCCGRDAIGRRNATSL